MYSAIKRGGKRLYELARRGESIEVAPRACRVDDVRLAASLGGGRYRLEVDCGKGVYIRTLCHDIGAALGCGGHMATLTRTRAGVFTLENALTLEDVEALGAEGLEAHLLPMDAAIAHLPAVRVDAAALPRCAQRQPPAPAWLDAPAPQAPAVRVYVGKNLPASARRVRTVPSASAPCCSNRRPAPAHGCSTSARYTPRRAIPRLCACTGRGASLQGAPIRFRVVKGSVRRHPRCGRDDGGDFAWDSSVAPTCFVLCAGRISMNMNAAIFAWWRRASPPMMNYRQG